MKMTSKKKDQLKKYNLIAGIILIILAWFVPSHSRQFVVWFLILGIFNITVGLIKHEK